MRAKGVIKDAVPWAGSREYFYNLARRRIAQDDFIAKAKAADRSLSTASCLETLQGLCTADWEDNKAVGDFFEAESGTLSAKITEIKKASIVETLEALQAELSALE